MTGVREWVAYRIAPWLFVPYREDREEAFRRLSEVAYGSRDAVWTSPIVLAETALKEAVVRHRKQAKLDLKRYDPGFGTVDCTFCDESILCIIGGPPKDWKWSADGWLCPKCVGEES